MKPGFLDREVTHILATFPVNSYAFLAGDASIIVIEELAIDKGCDAASNPIRNEHETYTL